VKDREGFFVSGLNLQIDPALIEPIIAAVVAKTIAALDAERAQLNGRLAYPEAEAATLLGLHRHQLRDERLKGRIAASVGPGRKVLYTRQDLLDYLAARRWEPER
jgi:hypothetical protein